MNKYQNIFTPLTIKNMTIRNRIAMPPMGTNYGGAMGDFTEEHVQYYEKRAKGGTGLIIVENACVDFPMGSNGTTQIRLDHDRYMPNLFRLTERLHRQGACVAIQINHSGASAVPGRIEGNTPVSSSNVPSKAGGAIPRPLTVEEKEPELSVEEMLASTKENQPSVDDIDLQEKSETRKAIEKFVDENPEAVALLLRNWLNDDW